MKQFTQLSKEKQTIVVTDIFKQFVTLVVGDNKTRPVLEMDFPNKKDNGYLQLIRQAAQETGDYEAAYVQAGRKFYNQFIKMSKIVAQDSNYTDNGEIITDVLPGELH